MSVLHDLFCKACDLEVSGILVEPGCYPDCPKCGGPSAVDFSKLRIHADIWGQSHFVRGLDRTFDSKSDLRSYLKKHGLAEAGDRVKGARTAPRKEIIYSHS